jgi:hypothetical protein
MTSELLAGAHAAHTSHSRKLTAALRRSAYEAGWPAQVARHLHVTHANDEIDVRFPHQMADHVHDFEHGTQDRLAIPAIRQFMNRLEQYDHLMDSELHGFIHGMEVLD